MTKAMELTGNFDFHDVVIKGNVFTLPNSTFSTASLLTKELGSEIAPTNVYDNQISDSTGIRLADTIGPGKGGTGAGALTANSVPFIGAAGVYSQNNGAFYWDNANSRLFVVNPAHAEATPIAGFHTGGRGIFDGGLSFQWDSGASNYSINMQYSALSGGFLDIQSYTGKPIVLNNQGNNVGIGKIPTTLLDVNGTIRGIGLAAFGAANTATASVDAAASTASAASIRVRPGVAPTIPNSGDVWQDGTHLYAFINGVARQLDQQGAGGGTGTVTSISVASVNGFNGTVSAPTTTPAISIGTSLSGMLKGNGTAMLAATAGTDYQAPIALTTTGSGAATFASGTLNIPTPAAASFTSLTTTDTSGAATLLSGVLNIPNYASGGFTNPMTTAGDIIYGSTSGTPTRLGQAAGLLHGGATPSWSAVSLTADVGGTLPVANGGTGVTSSTGTGSVVLSVSPALTGAPTAPTATVGTNTTQLATTAFTQAAVGATTTKPVTRTDQRGVALSGMEFAPSTLPGVANTDYATPTEADFQYFAGKGLQLVRLPFLWERLQPTLNGTLNSAYLGYIDSAVGFARKYGMRLVLDCHNYGRYSISGVTHVIGDGTLTTANFADLWSRIATYYFNEPTVFMYDLMNEWHNMAVPLSSTTYNSTATVTLANQAAINAIRAVDTNTWVSLESDTYTGLQNFTSMYGTNPSKWWTDSANKTMLSFHYYQDSDYSGTYTTAWSSALRTRITSDVTPALKWAETNSVPVFIGEYGVPNGTSSDAVNWQADMDTFLQILDSYRAYASHWSAGSWYNSATSLQPTSSYTVDREQMAVVQKHLSFGGSTGATAGSGLGLQGPVGMVWRGAYNNATTYGTNDAVQYNGSSFIATAGVTGVTPGTPTSPNSPWQLIAQIGNPGSAGSGAVGVVSPGSFAYVAWTHDPVLNSGQNSLSSSGEIYGTIVYLTAGQVITGVDFVQGSTVGATLTAAYFGLYDPSGNRVAVTADQHTSLASGTNQTKTATFASSFTVVTTGIYYIAALGVTGTMPSFAAVSSGGDSSWNNVTHGSNTYRFVKLGGLGGQTTLPTSVTLSSNARFNFPIWFGLY